MTIRLLILFTGLMMGAKNLCAEPAQAKKPAEDLKRAKQHLGAGQLYKAKKITKGILEEYPEDPWAEQVMAQIISQELERHKKAFDAEPPEALNEAEKSDEAKTWLERARSLRELGQYEQALLAAEKVFLFDSDSVKASGLVDEIKQDIMRGGREESLTVKRLYESEISVKVEQYKRQANRGVREGRWGMARLAVEKVLLLRPRDSEALKLHRKIKDHLESKKA